MELTCPKCQGTMRTYERNGVHVDQCSECRGIFLDRGELEKLVDAETTWHGGGSGSDAHRRTSAPMPGSQLTGTIDQPPARRRDRDDDDDDRHRGYGYPPRKKKESFLSDLFG